MNLMWRLTDGELPRVNFPKVVMLLIGECCTTLNAGQLHRGCHPPW